MPVVSTAENVVIPSGIARATDRDWTETDMVDTAWDTSDGGCSLFGDGPFVIGVERERMVAKTWVRRGLGHDGVGVRPKTPAISVVLTVETIKTAVRSASTMSPPARYHGLGEGLREPAGRGGPPPPRREAGGGEFSSDALTAELRRHLGMQVLAGR